EIRDFRCRRPISTRGAEEYASSHHVVLVRSGVFVKHGVSGEVLAEPLHALFFNRAEAFQVSHPVADGDDCTVLSFPSDVLCEAIAVHDPAARDRPEAPFAHGMTLAGPRTLLAD